MTFKKKKKNFDCTYFLQFTKSPHFPLRGKVGHGQITEISKGRERELCWSISILLVYDCRKRRRRGRAVWRLSLAGWTSTPGTPEELTTTST